MTREELTEKMKDLPNPPCRVNLIQQVWEIMNDENEQLNKENGKLEGKLADLQSEYVELENFKNNEVNELKAQLTKAKQLLAFWVDDFYDAFNRTIKYEELHEALVETEQFLKEADK